MSTTAPSIWAQLILWAMNIKGQPMYEGTVPRRAVERRRAANKRARASRRVNR